VRSWSRCVFTWYPVYPQAFIRCSNSNRSVSVPFPFFRFLFFPFYLGWRTHFPLNDRTNVVLLFSYNLDRQEGAPSCQAWCAPFSNASTPTRSSVSSAQPLTKGSQPSQPCIFRTYAHGGGGARDGQCSMPREIGSWRHR
jgi:hypothetical protein